MVGMRLSILPLQGAGELRFGMSVDEARAHATGRFSTFRRTPQANPCDFYEDQGMFLYYDDDGKLEAIEWANTAQPQPILAGMALLGKSFGEAKSDLRSLSTRLEEELDGAIAFDLGVSIWVPLARDTAPVESVLAFREGYYD